MDGKNLPSFRRLGYWSAVLAAVFSLAYVVGQLAEWLGLLGSKGGPENPSTAKGLILLLTPSLLLAFAFVVTMVCVHRYAPESKKAWSQVAVAFATAYAALIGIVYFTQLTIVVPHLLRGDVAGIEFLLFKPFDSFLYAVDILGYSFMSLSTLFSAAAFSGGRLERTTRFFLVANGLLVPFLAFQMYIHSLIWIASLWAVTFPAAMICLALVFKRLPRGEAPAA
ncbi:MAG TPA: hypothetical protein P5119_11280 [Candidatus Aminicenantes bacterium]|nr:hypothetical protein [Candidatus Aminicenantes bacterium]HRY65907.1 hypothetical protein [Candidatus Aminicenantes bacterium]HRZ72767.1 hypothetical protein [Candidatus Aminicenantes bacterium]